MATAGQLYNAACVYSLAAAAIKPDAGRELTAEQTRQREQNIQEALATLKLAITAGWNDAAHMRKGPLRNHPDFQKLVGDLEKSE